MILRKLILTAALAFCLNGPVLAQDVKDLAERMKYATEFHDVYPIRLIIDKDIEAAAQQVQPADREDFMRYIQLRMDYDAIEQTSIKAMADTFTVLEIKAMIAYYGSAEGRAAEDKMGGYIEKVAPDIRKAVDAALMDAQLGPSQ